MSADFTSFSSNFISASSGGVDPRTGMYNYQFSIATLTGNAGLGPNLNIGLAYSPLTTTNIGFGSGFSLLFSRYDKSTKTLQLSTGESYKVTEVGNKINILYAKPQHFRIKVQDDGYYIYHKDGTIERLTAPKKGGDIKVTETIKSPGNREMSLKWEIFGNNKRLLAISDEFSDLLVINYTAAGVNFNVWPKSSEHYVIKLKIQNEFLISASNLNVDPTLSWSFEYNNKRLTTVTSPTGLKDRVIYNQNGHQFPLGSHNPRLPYVSRYWQTGTDGELISDRRYVFSDKNFLGFGGNSSSSWNKDTDFLYGMVSDYQYSSTETAVDKNGSPLMKVLRTYGNYHLQIKEDKQLVGSGCSSVVETVYNMITGRPFESQPTQFQLPKKVTTTYTDNSLALNERTRTDITLTEFDDFGNLIKEKASNGLITEYIYYPAEGEDGHCPPDPNGFVRFLKKKITYPIDSEYSMPERSSVFTYGRLGDTSAIVQTSLTEYNGQNPLFKIFTFYNTELGDPQFGRVITQLFDKYTPNSTKSYQQRTEINTRLTDGLLTQTTTNITHDGLTQVTQQTQSCYSNNIVSEINSNNIKTNYAYDKLGRLIETVSAVGTDYEFAIRYEYIIEPTGLVTLVKNSLNQQEKTYFDSLGREIERHQYDPDNSKKWYLVSSKSYDLLGKEITGQVNDWLTTSTNSTPLANIRTNAEYSRWGLNNRITVSTLGTDITDIDPIKLIQEQYSTSKINKNSGKTITRLDPLNMLPYRSELKDSANRIKAYSDYLYDGYGQLRRVVNEQGHIKLFTYDEFGRELSNTLPDGTKITKEYPPYLMEELPSKIYVTGIQSDGKENTWLIGERELDGLGRVTKERVGGRSTTYRYKDSNMFPSQIFTPSGGRIEKTYIPELDYVVKDLSAFDNTTSLIPKVKQSFEYTSLGNQLIRMEEGNNFKDNKWSISGGLIEEKIVLGAEQPKTMEYEYSLSGSVISYTDISGHRTHYDYDTQGRIISLTDDTLISTYGYDDFSRIKTKIATNSQSGITVTTHFEYDDFSRETKQTLKDSDGQELIVQQTWSSQDQIIERETKLNGRLVKKEQYVYDVRNRLVNYSVEGEQLPVDAYGYNMKSQSYDYDCLNNLLKVETYLSDNTRDIAIFYYENDNDPVQLTKVTHTHSSYPAEIQLTYDSEGRMITDESGRHLTYDVLGRLQTCNEGQYSYDALNRLVSQGFSDSERRDIYYRDDNPVNHVNFPENTLSRLIKDGNKCIGINDDGRIVLTETDRNNSLLWSRSPEQSSGDIHAWSPYGSGSINRELPGFNGEFTDLISGTYHLGNGYRAYNPVLMRFNCPDSFSPFNQGGMNSYAYCLGDPINNTDPSGHISKAGIAGLFAGIIGIITSTITLGASSSLSIGAIVSLTTGLAADVTGIMSIALEDKKPEASSVLGWVSLGLGISSVGLAGTGVSRRATNINPATEMELAGHALSQDVMYYSNGKLTTADKIRYISPGEEMYSYNGYTNNFRGTGEEALLMHGYSDGRMRVGGWDEVSFLGFVELDNMTIATPETLAQKVQEVLNTRVPNQTIDLTANNGVLNLVCCHSKCFAQSVANELQRPVRGFSKGSIYTSIVSNSNMNELENPKFSISKHRRKYNPLSLFARSKKVTPRVFYPQRTI